MHVAVMAARVISTLQLLVIPALAVILVAVAVAIRGMVAGMGVMVVLALREDTAVVVLEDIREVVALEVFLVLDQPETGAAAVEAMVLAAVLAAVVVAWGY
jgi:hypothetical protein